MLRVVLLAVVCYTAVVSAVPLATHRDRLSHKTWNQAVQAQWALCVVTLTGVGAPGAHAVTQSNNHPCNVLCMILLRRAYPANRANAAHANNARSCSVAAIWPAAGGGPLYQIEFSGGAPNWGAGGAPVLVPMPTLPAGATPGGGHAWYNAVATNYAKCSQALLVTPAGPTIHASDLATTTRLLAARGPLAPVLPVITFNNDFVMANPPGPGACSEDKIMRLLVNGDAFRMFTTAAPCPHTWTALQAVALPAGTVAGGVQHLIWDVTYKCATMANVSAMRRKTLSELTNVNAVRHHFLATGSPPGGFDEMLNGLNNGPTPAYYTLVRNTIAAELC